MKSATQVVGSTGIVRRYWDGELSLAKSCLLSAAIWIPLQVALQLSTAGSRDIFTASIHIPLAGFQLLILAWLAVGVWRAAQRYQGPRFWSSLVRIAVVVVAILNVLALTQVLSQPLTPTSIKMKPTILYSILALLLLGSLKLKNMISDPWWRMFALHFAFLFLALAAINEIIWRTFSTAAWVTWKVWGILPIIILFVLVEVVISKHRRTQSGQAPEHSTDHEKSWAAGLDNLNDRLRSSGLPVTVKTSKEAQPPLSATLPPRRHPKRD